MSVATSTGELLRHVDRSSGSSAQPSRWFAAIAFAGIAAVGVRPARGGTNVWTTNGPQGGLSVTSLAINPITPATLYAATVNGVFKSIDGGLSWAAVNGGLDPGDLTFQSLTIDPHDPNTLYFASGYDGVFKTTDGGGNWARSNDGLTIDFILSVALDATAPTTIYAGAESRGVWKSVDSADSWSSADEDLDEISVLTVDPTSSAVVYAGTSHGVFKTTDGTPFVPMNDGLTGTAANVLVIDPVDSATLYLGTADGVFKSTDAAMHWMSANAGIGTLNIDALAIDPTAPGTIYCGSAGGGVFKSTDGGANWVPLNSGLTNMNVASLVIDPSHPATLYVGTFGGGVFRIDQLAPTPTATSTVAASTATPLPLADSSSCRIVGGASSRMAWPLLVPAAALLALHRRRRR